MDRRSFFRKTAVGVAAGSALSTPSIAASPRLLTMVTSWNRRSEGTFGVAERLAATLNKLWSGEIVIELKAAGELLGPLEVFDAVSEGQAAFYHAADHYFVDRHPAFALFTGAPFGMTPEELLNWRYHLGGGALHDELAAEFAVKPFQAGDTGARSGGWFRREVTSPEDFQGLRIRMPGLGGRVLAKLGASIQNIPSTEVYRALASDTLDGTDWSGPWDEERQRLKEVAEFYYPTGFHQPSMALTLGANLKVYETLSDQQKTVLKVAAAETNIWCTSHHNTNSGAAFQWMLDAGVKTREFPDSVFTAAAETARKIYEAYMPDPMFRKIYESYREGLRAGEAWTIASNCDYRRARTHAP